MSKELIIGAIIVAIGAIVAFVTPIIKICSTFQKLTDEIKYFRTDYNDQKEIIKEHTQDIGMIKGKIIEHDLEITNLKEK